MRSNQVRQQQALDLHNAGFSYPQIAERLGYTSAGSARSAIVRARRLLNLGRQFGIEIEFNGITRDAALAAVTAAGIACSFGSWTGTRRPESYWTLTTDGSVRSTGTGCASGLEFVSPILRDEDGYSQVIKVMDALASAGATVDRSCGMHVHHDADGLSGEEIASVFEFYTNRQDAIDKLVSPSRRGTRSYTGPFESGELRNITDSFRSSRTAPEYAPRYRHVNAQAFRKHGTIEIRQHQGSVNGEKAVAWIKFGQAMIKSAQANASTTVPLTVFEMVQTLSNDHGLDADAAGYLVNRAMHFTSAE